MNKPDFDTIPLTPGVYLFKDEHGRILYVGKAKVLRKRLASYFREEHSLAPKTRVMVSQAASLETISTVTEKEALLLEAGLIKKHRPRYNIVLRDDKDYILFRIDYSHSYPRLELTRQPRKKRNNGSVKLFGPFSSAGDAKATWKALHRIFRLRRCNDRAFKNRNKACLYYHIGQCSAPCVQELDPAEYAARLKQVAMLLTGRSRDLIDRLQEKMLGASEALRFEEAADLRDQIKAVEKTVERQAVVLPGYADLDVLGVAEATGGLALGLIFVRQGTLLGGRSFFWAGLALEDAPELILSFLLQFYTQNGNVPPRIISPFLSTSGEDSVAEAARNAENPDAPENRADEITALEALLGDLAQENDEEADGEVTGEAAGEANEAAAPRPGKARSVRLSAPRGPDEERLVSLAATNAREYAKNMRNEDLAETLAQALHSPRPVKRIEAVDISHTGGAQTKAGMVVFEDGRPLREDWRAYNVEDAGPGDDYAALANWAARRVKSGPPWPDLLLVDGGKGQLGAVCRALAEAAPDLPGFPLAHFQVAGIAKARDDEDGALPGLAARLAARSEASSNAGNDAQNECWNETKGSGGGAAGEATKEAAKESGGVPGNESENETGNEAWQEAGQNLSAPRKSNRAIRRANAEDRIFLPGRSNPLPLRQGSPELLYLQNIRDNVHDFALGRHRAARSARSLESELARLPGLGPRLAAALWQRFGSLQAMAKATEEELQTVPGIGREKAKAVKEHLKVIVAEEKSGRGKSR